jgi:drug/metabolite transporter (DMT)-like permease
VGAAALAWLFLDEAPGPLTLIGATIILSGIYVTARYIQSPGESAAASAG